MLTYTVASLQFQLAGDTHTKDTTSSCSGNGVGGGGSARCSHSTARWVSKDKDIPRPFISFGHAQVILSPILPPPSQHTFRKRTRRAFLPIRVSVPSENLPPSYPPAETHHEAPKQTAKLLCVFSYPVSSKSHCRNVMDSLNQVIFLLQVNKKEKFNELSYELNCALPQNKTILGRPDSQLDSTWKQDFREIVYSDPQPS